MYFLLVMKNKDLRNGVFFFFLEFFYDSHLSLPSLPLDIKQRKVCRKNMSWNIWLNHDFMHISTKKDLAPDRFGQPPLTLLIPDNKLAINLQWSQSRHPHFSVMWPSRLCGWGLNMVFNCLEGTPKIIYQKCQCRFVKLMYYIIFPRC